MSSSEILIFWRFGGEQISTQKFVQILKLVIIHHT